MKKDFISDESTANELNFKKLKVFLRFVRRTIFFCKVKMSDFLVLWKLNGIN